MPNIITRKSDGTTCTQIRSPGTVTKEIFIDRVGREPENDDLERCNCNQAGKIGHMLCGWCPACDLPRFVCGHYQIPQESITITKGE